MTRAKYAAAIIALSLACGAGLAFAQPRDNADACDATFRIYFRADASRLNRPAQDVIAAAADELAACAAPVAAFAASDETLSARRKFAIVRALHDRGIDATPIEMAQASRIASVREGTPAYVQVSLAPTEREAVAALKEAVPQQRTRRDPLPTS